jgi:hypothetical protein
LNIESKFVDLTISKNKNKQFKTKSVMKTSEMNYNELRAAVVELSLVVENSKKETLIAALEAHYVANGEGEKAAPGRPVDPNSARQKRLAEMEARKVNGEIRLGRPVNPDSARQQVLAARAEGTSLGRPVDPNSKRQLELAAYQAKIAAGYVPVKGRPKGTGKNQKVSAEEAKEMKQRFQVVITDAEGKESNYTKSFSKPAQAIKEMKSIGIDIANFKLVEFTEMAG